MASRCDAREGYYATAANDSLPFAASLAAARASTTYLDFPVGEYDCWIPSAAAGDVLLVAYLPVTEAAPTPTIAPWALPTAAALAQTSGRPSGAAGAAVLPGDRSPLRIPVLHGFRCAVVFTGAALTLYASKVL